ncbi:engA (nucleomorph) [Hemiselmis andersenii]|uniref:GTPase Der n=1 Tax=Hemiselmis andersenii TaxID=464988 RepID=A9BKJ6_HEMAN|nr:engA [Hemiselmis andersenii]ABW98167.1 engA [Hemiselmis andersenii]|mmetsp:Transcript_23271/g.54052  ORF Transcript_23271/g.54052 Transcript_23271/m.54052 type:complete len:520 (-) Transcript_23271:126-1685(-)
MEIFFIHTLLYGKNNFSKNNWLNKYRKTYKPNSGDRIELNKKLFNSKKISINMKNSNRDREGLPLENSYLKNQNRRIPIVAIVGRGNVGKSTLVNRISGAFEDGSIVHDLEGVTRDKNYRKAFWCEHQFLVTDTGGFAFEENNSNKFEADVKEQALKAIEEANVIIFVVDGKCELDINDIELANYLKFQKTPVLLAVNKSENLKKFDSEGSKFWSLGFGEPIPISAIHGTNTDVLLDKTITHLPKISFPFSETSIKVAIIGKPNVGKSSILNFLTNKKRAIVSDIPGTTRDSCDSFISGGSNSNIYNLIDTAGIRKKKMIEYGPEFFMINRTFKAIQKCDCVLFVIDASTGITEQDQKLSERIQEQGKSCVIIFNKWDKISSKDKLNFQKFKLLIKRMLQPISWADVLFTSAINGNSCNKIFDYIDSAITQYNRHVSTSIYNEIVQEAIKWKAPPLFKTGKQGKIYYCTQVSDQPPGIAIFVNDSNLFNDTYKKYIEAQFRTALGFKGTSLKIFWTTRR